jgi:hypothetical protein
MHSGQSLIDFIPVAAAAVAEDIKSTRRPRRSGVSALRKGLGSVLINIGNRIYPSPPAVPVPQRAGG